MAPVVPHCPALVAITDSNRSKKRERKKKSEEAKRSAALRPGRCHESHGGFIQLLNTYP